MREELAYAEAVQELREEPDTPEEKDEGPLRLRDAVKHGVNLK